MSFLRTVWSLSRPAGLPTVWSNCLAGWWLSGGGNLDRLPFLFTGVSLLYLGGVFLHDTFDAEYDRQHDRKRPIPGGKISFATVQALALLLLAAGSLCLIWLDKLTGALALALVACLVLYNAIHRLIALSPVLLGICRFLLYLIAGSTATGGITGWCLWCGLALAAYVTGLGCFKRLEPLPGPRTRWPLALLAAPLCLALILDDGNSREPGLLLSAIFALWSIRSLRYTLWGPDKDLARTVSGLFAGIVLVDLLATADAPRLLSALFLGLFALTLLLQWPASRKAV